MINTWSVRKRDHLADSIMTLLNVSLSTGFSLIILIKDCCHIADAS